MYSFSPQVHCYETCQNSYKIVKSKISADITPLLFPSLRSTHRCETTHLCHWKHFKQLPRDDLCLWSVSKKFLLQDSCNDQGDTLYSLTHFGSRVDKVYWTTGYGAEEKGDFWKKTTTLSWYLDKCLLVGGESNYRCRKSVICHIKYTQPVAYSSPPQPAMASVVDRILNDI